LKGKSSLLANPVGLHKIDKEMPINKRKPSSSGQQKPEKRNTWQQCQGNGGRMKVTIYIPNLQYGKGIKYFQFRQIILEDSISSDTFDFLLKWQH
jgi:hypothetical protein